MRILIALGAAAVALAFALPGTQDAPAGEPSARTPEEARRIVESLSWLTGHWVGTAGANRYETVYTSPTRGELYGASKEFNDERIATFDFERMHSKGGDVFMTPWPMGRKSRSFKLTDYDPTKRRLHFVNNEHDFPRAFTYALDTTGRLEIRLVGTIGGEDVSSRIVMAKLGK